MTRNARIGDRQPGPGEPVFVVVETGTTDHGDVDMTLRLVDAAADGGADAAPPAARADVVVRCDGSGAIGMGHVRRCLTLAEALRAHGVAVAFVMRDLPGPATALARAAGFDVTLVGGAAPGVTMLGQDDLAQTIAAAQVRDAALVLVDHYGASAAYLTGLASAGQPLAVIDDLADRDLTPADWILNQNPGASAGLYRGRTHPQATLLLGPAYALVRPAFAQQRALLARAFGPDDRRVLVTLGGGDVATLSAGVVAALDGVTQPLDVRCTIGGHAADEALPAAVAASRHQVEILRDADDMAEHMAWADLSINAGGSTCWELCCLGVPMIVLVTAPNQAPNAAALQQAGLAHDLGAWQPGAADPQLAATAQRLLARPAWRAAASARGQALVDGQGATRAAAALAALLRAPRGRT